MGKKERGFKDKGSNVDKIYSESVTDIDFGGMDKMEGV